MSILIRGMEMPTSCHNCEMSTLVDVSEGFAYGCRVLKEMISDDRERLPNCPLIHVPPHGRLIDADDMESFMSNTVQGDIRGYSYADTTWETAFRWLDSRPTIIEAEGQE